jgi:hypothetical protein
MTQAVTENVMVYNGGLGVDLVKMQANAEEAMEQLMLIVRGQLNKRGTSLTLYGAGKVLEHYRWCADRFITPEARFVASFGGPEAAAKWLSENYTRLRAMLPSHAEALVTGFAKEQAHEDGTRQGLEAEQARGLEGNGQPALSGRDAAGPSSGDGSGGVQGNVRARRAAQGNHAPARRPRRKP